MDESIKIIKDKVSINELKKIAENQFGNLVKAVVDVEKKIMAIGGELHADEETQLLENRSMQNNLWGINIYTEKPKEEWVEFDSIINIRPSLNNRSRDVEDPIIRKIIIEIVNDLIEL